MSDPTSHSEQITRGCRDWIDQNLLHFRLPSADDPLLVHMIKPAGELAIVCDCVMHSSATNPDLRDWAGEILSFCWKEFREGGLFEAVLMTNPDMLVTAWLYASFKRNGLISGSLEKAFRRLMKLDAIRSTDIPAWRLLEASVALTELGIENPWHAETLYGRTWIASTPEPWTICLRDAYALTHTVFYATRFGRRPLGDPAIAKDVRDYLECWIPVWLEYYSTENNFDIFAELLIVIRCLQLDIWDERWISTLCKVQQGDGAILGPTICGWGPAIGEALPAKRYFLQNYHTTLVGLLASAMGTSAKRYRSRGLASLQ